MRPGPLLPRVVGILAVASFAIALVDWAVWLIGAGALIVLAVSISELIELRAVTFQLDRKGSFAMSLGDVATVPMALTADNRKPLEIQFRQVWPRLLDRQQSVHSASLNPNERATFNLDIRAIARGSTALRPPTIALTRRGLVERVTDVGSPAELSVIPNIAAVGRLHRLLNQFILRGHGSRSSPRLGKGRDFERLRDHVDGDDLRDVAWKATARHGKLIVREFRVERSQNIVICVDRGHRMAERVGGLSRLDHAVNTALLLAYVANRTEDRIGIQSFSSKVDGGVAPGGGATHLRSLTRFVTALEPGYAHTDYPALAHGLRRTLRKRSLIVIFTMLPHLEIGDELVKAVSVLHPNHLVLIAVQFDPTLDAIAHTPPRSSRELSKFLVARDLWEARTGLIRDLQNRGALVVDSRPGELATDSINAYLDVKRRQIL